MYVVPEDTRGPWGQKPLHSLLATPEHQDTHCMPDYKHNSVGRLAPAWCYHSSSRCTCLACTRTYHPYSSSSALPLSTELFYLEYYAVRRGARGYVPMYQLQPRGTLVPTEKGKLNGSCYLVFSIRDGCDHHLGSPAETHNVWLGETKKIEDRYTAVPTAVGPVRYLAVLYIEDEGNLFGFRFCFYTK